MITCEICNNKTDEGFTHTLKRTEENKNSVTMLSKKICECCYEQLELEEEGYKVYAIINNEKWEV